MKRSYWLSLTLSALVVAACARSSMNPSAPTGTNPLRGALNPDGSVLKVSAPTPQSPINSPVDFRKPSLEVYRARVRSEAISQNSMQ